MRSRIATFPAYVRYQTERLEAEGDDMRGCSILPLITPGVLRPGYGNPVSGLFFRRSGLPAMHGNARIDCRNGC